MFAKIIIYGDSFSTPAICRTDEVGMWYRSVFPSYGDSHFLNRARPGNSVGNRFLESGHDWITHSGPSMLVIAMGPLQRLSSYTDGWYEQEKLKEQDPESARDLYPLPARKNDLSDCEKYLEGYSVNKQIKDKRIMNLFHPTLLWSSMYDQIIKLDALASRHGHSILVLHMSHLQREYNEKHPLVYPLEQAALQCNYITEEHSCHAVCKEAGIKPWDFEEYRWFGHHSREGQKFFGEYIKKLLSDRHSDKVKI
jgi:hypothetical protein